MTLTQLFTSIANAIRSKKGTSATIKAEDFATEISGIVIGTDTSDANAVASDIKTGKTAYVNAQKITGTYTGIVPTGTVSITQNGTTDVTNYANASVNVTPELQSKSVTITQNGTQTITPDTGNDGLSSVEVTTNVSTEKDVKFYDYDGTVLYEYSKSTFLALTEMPANPIHTGLTAQGWNWTLANAKTYVTNNNKLNIGQMYATTSGLSEFDIELNNSTGLTVTLKMDGTKNWGDGTSDTSTSHTYTDLGKYTITCNGTTLTATSNSGLFGQYNGGENYYVRNIRFANITEIANYAMARCRGLVGLILPNTLTSAKNYAFLSCYSLKFVVLPTSLTSLSSSMFSDCYSLDNIIMTNSTITINSYAFNNCYSLNNITIPSSATIATASFMSCYALEDIIIPSDAKLQNSVFGNCYGLKNITIPNITNMQASLFSKCYGLKKVIISNSTTTIDQYAFTECYSLENVELPSSITTINDYAFDRCYCMKVYDFSNFTSIPTLGGSNVFSKINQSAKIIVPDNLYSTWIATNNWSNYANYIVKASEYNV